MQVVLNLKVEAAKVSVDGTLKGLPVAAKLLLNHLSKRKKSHGDLEAGDASLEADLLLLRLHYHVLSFVLLVSMIKFWDLENNPESLTIELLFKVGLKEVHQVELIADYAHREDVTKGRGEILHTLVCLFLEDANLLVDDRHDTRNKLDTEAEQTDEVDKTSDGENGNVLVLIGQFNNVRDDELWHDLHHHLSSHFLVSIAFREEADRVLE